MNKIIKELNEAFAAQAVTFKRMEACLWIENKLKAECERLKEENKSQKFKISFLKD